MLLRLSELVAGEFQSVYWTNCPTRYRVIFGARYTGKSYTFLGTEVLDKITRDPNRNVAIFRAVASDIKTTAFAEVKKALFRTGLFTKFQVKEHDVEIVYKATRQKIMFFGCDRGTAVNGIQCEVGEVTDFYFEEAYELKSYEEFRKIDGSLRGDYCTTLANGRKIPKQVTFLMNPWSKEGCWIHYYFVKPFMDDDNTSERLLENVGFRQYINKGLYIEKGLGLALHQSTYKVNHWRAKDYDKIALNEKKANPRGYRVEFLGMWGVSGDVVYTSYSEKIVLPKEVSDTLHYRCAYIGIDTAYSNGEGKTLTGQALEEARVKHAYSVQLVGVTRCDEQGVEMGSLVGIDEYYYSQEIYGKRKTQTELISETVSLILMWCDRYRNNPTLLKGQIVIYSDSGDQGSIDALVTELRNRHISNCIVMSSTKKPINTRIRFENQLMAHGRLRISTRCEHLKREFSHSREGKGKPREDLNDHAINAFEYASAPMYPLVKDWANFKEYR